MSDSIYPKSETFVDELTARLDELATLRLYRSNAFHVLQVPVNAKPREIARRQQMLEIAARAGTPAPASGYVSLGEPPDPEEAGRAVQLLQDPVTRILHEFFWIWNDGVAGIPTGLAGLDGLAGQIQFWNSAQSPVAVHNLAVLCHAAALELETSARSGAQTGESARQAEDFWKQAYTHWRALLDSDDFWEALSGRIQTLDDPRLTAEVSARMRTALPDFLFSVQARLLIDAIEQDRPAELNRHTALLEQARLGAQISEAATRKLIDPVRVRIQAYCASATQQAEQDPARASQGVLHLLEQCAPSLKIVDAIAPADSLLVTTLHDEVAEAGWSGLLCFYRKTDDWRVALSILKSVLAHARSDSTRQKIEEGVKNLQDAGKKNNFWHAPGYFDLPADSLGLLEQAHQLSDQEKFDEAVALLHANLKSPSLLSDSDWGCFTTALAYTLNARGMKHVEDGASKVNQYERPSVVRIRKNAESPSSDFLITFQAVQSGDLDLYGRMGMIHCMACGAKITGTYYTLKVNEAKAIICESCGHKDDQHRSRFSSEIKPILVLAQNDFLTATTILPDNLQAKENLEATHQIAANLQVSLPAARSVLSVPARKKTAARAAQPAQTPAVPVQARPGAVTQSNPVGKPAPGQKKKVSPLGACALVVAGVFLLSILCGLGSVLYAALFQAANTGTPTEQLAAVQVLPTDTVHIQPSATHPQNNTPTLAPVSAPQACTQVKLNVRRGPGTAYPILGAVLPDTCFPAVGINSTATWVKVQVELNGQAAEGWCSIEYLETYGKDNLLELPVLPEE